MDTFAAYCAGFFDGEGYVSISVGRGKAGRSDIHHIGVYASQRVRSREVLDRFQSRFGGLVTVRDAKLRNSECWAEQADWHIHKKWEIEAFCLALRPFSLVKARQLAIALEYVQGTEAAPPVRDALGRIRGRALTLAELEKRERLRLELKALNRRGSTRTERILPTPRPLQHVDRSQEVLKTHTESVSRGEKRYNSVLTDEKVRAIRAAYAQGNVTLEALGIQYGVSTAAIRQVVTRLSWKHVT